MGWHHVGAISIIITMGNVAVLSQMPFYRDYLGVGAMAGILVPFLIIDLLFATSYLRAMFTPPGEGRDVKSRRSRLHKDERGKRCYDCCEQKPDRTHHCSKCQKCVLRMDHHCPWINNCVGFKNHKFFYLTLIYGTLLQIYCIGLCAYYLSLFGSSATSLSPWAIYYCVTTVLVSISLVGTMILLVLHTFLLYVNRTTLEHFRLNTGAKYDLGCFANFSQIMGSSIAVWCVPCIWGVDNQVYNGGEWEPGKVIVVPSHSPEVLPALVGPASVGTANNWSGVAFGGVDNFSAHEGDGANSFSAAHKWRGDVLHNVSGNNVFEGHLETVPQHEGAVQQQQPWWNRGSESRGSGVWAYNSQQSTNKTSYNIPVVNGGNQSPLQQVVVKNAQQQWINGRNLTPTLSRSNSRDTLNSTAGPNQGIFVQGTPQSMTQSMSTMIGARDSPVMSVENGGAGNQGWSVHPAPQIRTLEQYTPPKQQQQHTVPRPIGSNLFPSEVRPTVATPRTAQSFGPQPPKLSPRGRPSYHLSGYQPQRMGDGGKSYLSRPGPKAVAM